MCRTLKLEYSSPEFIYLAGPASLLELIYRPDDSDVIGIPHIASLAALTRLQLEIWSSVRSADISILQKLVILELSIIEYRESIIGALMVPGALSALQKLYFEDRNAELEEFDSGLEKVREEVGSLKSIVFSLPSLLEVSGYSRLFLLEVPESWKIWLRCTESCNFKGQGHSFDPYCCHQIWRKVA